MSDQGQSRLHSPRKITPLFVFAIFVGLTETIAGLAAWRVSGTVQLILACFVVAFPILVLAAFVWLLWHRPYVLYGPTGAPHRRWTRPSC